MEKIQREGNELVVRIPLRQKSYDALGDFSGETDNVIGVIAGRECTLSHLIDLGYKGDQQEGSPILYFEDAEELREFCKEHDIQVWEHPICAYCNGPIRGVFTFGDKGNMCYSCELKEKP